MSRILNYRHKHSRLVAGIMSGTSLDGIDVAFVELSGSGGEIRHRLRGFHAVPFSPDMRRRLFDASAGMITLRETFELDADLGAAYTDAILEAARVNGLEPGIIDAIGLHGQTVYHAPRRKPNGVTVQLGSAAIVAEKLRTIVVNDFRSADVAAGGEGAPLVPYCDYVLLASREENRIALNIGGIANITWLPHDARPESLIAFDTGPGNMLIDAAMRELRGLEYDANGELAATGTPDTAWLSELLADEYYRFSPPKSAGRERFGEDVGRALARERRASGYSDADIIATLTLLTACSIAEGISMFAARGSNVDKVIIGGGGAANSTMMRMLASAMPGARIVPADTHGLPANAKEAICFAILANETLLEVPANVPSVTGASRAIICGAVTVG